MSELKDKVDKIWDKLEHVEIKEKKPKKFILPSKAKVSFIKAKKNYVILQKINENGQVDFKRVMIDDQTFMEDDIPRLAAAGYVTYYKKMPMIILPSWSVEPFSPMERYEKSLLDGSNSAGYRLLMNKMKTETTGIKKKGMAGTGKWIIGLIVAAVIGYALLSGSG